MGRQLGLSKEEGILIFFFFIPNSNIFPVFCSEKQQNEVLTAKNPINLTRGLMLAVQI